MWIFAQVISRFNLFFEREGDEGRIFAFLDFWLDLLSHGVEVRGGAEQSCLCHTLAKYCVAIR